MTCSPSHGGSLPFETQSTGRCLERIPWPTRPSCQSAQTASFFYYIVFCFKIISHFATTREMFLSTSSSSY